MIVHDSRCPKFNTAQIDWTHIWWWLGGQFHDAKGSRFEKADGSVGAKLKNSPNGSLRSHKVLNWIKIWAQLPAICSRSGWTLVKHKPPSNISPTNYGQLKWEIPRWSLILVSISASSTVGLGLSGSCDRSSCRGLSAGEPRDKQWLLGIGWSTELIRHVRLISWRLWVINQISELIIIQLATNG